MNQQILFDHIARQKLYKGLSHIVNIVKSNSLSIQNSGNNYGFIKQIKLNDPFENIGAQFAKSCIEKIAKQSNHGIIIGMILLDELVKTGLRFISSGIHPIFIKIGMNKGLTFLLEKIEQSVIRIKDENDFISILNMDQDLEYIKTLVKTLKLTGLCTSFLIEKNEITKTTIEIAQGLELPYGYSNSYFCTNSEFSRIEMKNASILMTPNTISSVYEILPILQSLNSNELFIIANDVNKDVLSTLTMNQLYNHLKISIVKASSLENILDKIVMLTNAYPMNNFYLGKARKVFIENNRTLLINESHPKNTHPIIVIKIGVSTRNEYKEKKHLIENHMEYIRGIIYSGYILDKDLLSAAQDLDHLHLNEKEMFGVNTLQQGCINFVKTGIKSFIQKDMLNPFSIIKHSLVQAVYTAGLILLSDVVIIKEDTI